MTTGVRFAAWAALAGSLAVLLAGLVALVVVDTTLDQVVDDRLDRAVFEVGARSTSITAACATVRGDGSSIADDQVVSVLDANGEEQCRSSAVAPSPRALRVPDEDGTATRVVDGARWRLHVTTSERGTRVVAAENVEAHELARADARRAIVVAMVVGVLIAAAGGAIAAVPARRRIARLLDRIRAAGRDRTGSTTVGRIGGRDLDAAAHSFDELLADVRAAEVAQRRLVSDAAHQLRTPLTSLRTNAQLLERRDDLDPDARDLAARIARQSAAVSDLVSGLVDYTAIAAWSGDRAEVVLDDLVREAVDRAATRWPAAAFVVEGDDSGAHVDGELVVRALGNVLDNAVVHGGGQVRVQVDRGVVRVTDDGPGFTIEGDAFQPFSSGGGGTGLGLAFVRHVARGHGGDAWIASREPAVVAMRFAPDVVVDA